MAEAVFRSLSSPHSHRFSRISSAGTGAYHAHSPPDPRTISVLRKHGITSYDHGARKVSKRDFEEFDLLIAMDRDNVRELERMKRRVEGRGGGVKARVRLFGEFDGEGGEVEEVGDPYYGRDDGFEEVFQQVLRFSRGLLREVLGWEEGEGGKGAAEEEG